MFIHLIMVPIVLQRDGTENKESLKPKSLYAYKVFWFALFGEKLWLVKTLDRSRMFMILPSHALCPAADPEDLFEVED